MEAVLTNDTFIVFAFMTIMFTTPWVVYYWHKARVAEANAAVKIEMVRRGMSAEEIRTVLEGSAPAERANDEERVARSRGRWRRC